jgi:hypothetical protein
LIAANHEPDLHDRIARRPASYRHVLLDRNVLLIATGYLSERRLLSVHGLAVTYFVEEKGYGLLASGLLYALPFVTGAVFAGLGGIACDVVPQGSDRAGDVVSCDRWPRRVCGPAVGRRSRRTRTSL